jgi:DNA-binding NarL/FixJ family response regulator
MQRLKIALIVPDGITRRGMLSLIKQSNYASCKVFEFEHFNGFNDHMDALHLIYFDISTLMIDALEEQTQAILTSHPSAKLVIISNRLAVLHIHRILQLGAKGFIHREELEVELLHSIDIVLRDTVVLSPQAQNLLLSTDKLYLTEELREVDLQVLRLMSNGLSTKEIAKTLAVSTKTIYRIRDRLRDLLDVPNTEMILDAAREQGLLNDISPE